jgi:sugar O-acyltransferase (sialic acid O-acetyltransferase NeuD family)
MRPKVVVLGAGGHGKVVLELLLLDKTMDVAGLIDANPALRGTTVLGVPVLGGDDQIARSGATGFVVGIGNVGNPEPRRRVFDAALARGLSPVRLVHPSATISGFAEVGEGTVVMAGAIVNPGAVLGRNVIVNTGAIVDHDCRIGDHAHVAPGARLSGGVTVGRSALIGVGASVRQGIAIGEEAIVGAGAVVVGDVAARVTVVGTPARAPLSSPAVP